MGILTILFHFLFFLTFLTKLTIFTVVDYIEANCLFHFLKVVDLFYYSCQSTCWSKFLKYSYAHTFIFIHLSVTYVVEMCFVWQLFQWHFEFLMAILKGKKILTNILIWEYKCFYFSLSRHFKWSNEIHTLCRIFFN